MTKNTSQILSVKLLLIIALGFNFTSCDEPITEFKTLYFDWSEDYISEIAAGMNPENEYDYWACLRSGLPSTNSISVLFETKDNFSTSGFKLFENGFYIQGHTSAMIYYIVTIKNENTSYITEVAELKKFLGKIDTMEEALMLAKINGFGIDSDNTKGSSFRKIKNGFEFLLMKNEEFGGLKFRQYLVQVDEDGKIISEKREVYCHGYSDCYKNTKFL